MMTASSPDGFSLRSAVPVVRPDAVGVDAVKDPYVFSLGGPGGDVLMFVSTFLTPQGPAPTSLATSADGAQFSWRDQALAVGEGWDGYQARISSVMPFGKGFVAYYDGAASAAEDTEERCGLAVSIDLRAWRRGTPRQPALVSPHATGSLRYVEAVRLQDGWWAYYEYTRRDGSHELRRNFLGG